ncbi:MAG TPA: hypothetical protein VMV56_07535 [Williamwhitmania sp.]|nr:hypothetical protein [Williamwhitmania sp.]
MKKVLFLAMLLIVVLAVPLFAQDDIVTIPPFLSIVFNEGFIVAVGLIITATKLLRNMVGGVKGWPAVILVLVISLGYGYFKYHEISLVYSLGAGAIAFACSAGLFKSTKWLGKIVQNWNAIKTWLKNFKMFNIK